MREGEVSYYCVYTYVLVPYENTTTTTYYYYCQLISRTALYAVLHISVDPNILCILRRSSEEDHTSSRILDRFNTHAQVC